MNYDIISRARNVCVIVWRKGYNLNEYMEVSLVDGDFRYRVMTHLNDDLARWVHDPQNYIHPEILDKARERLLFGRKQNDEQS